MSKDSLQDFVREVSGENHLRVEHDFGGGFVRLHTSEAERRQAAQDIQCTENIVIELLRNSRDAHASHIYLATAREGSKRTLTVIDDGDGIPATMHDHVFEPRVTSKLDSSHRDDWGYHGRGMALFSIAENTLEARVVDSDEGLGCSMHIVSDLKALKERSDQSSFPTFLLEENGTVNIRGPRNILRTACEFSITARDTCTVFVGSPAEIAATVYAHGIETLSAIDRVFCHDVTQLPLVKRLATASDPVDLANLAKTLGLDISSRTARRIIDGQISAQDSLLTLVEFSVAGQAPGQQRKKAPRKHPKPKLTVEEKYDLAQAVGDAFKPLAKRYYLNGNVEPRISVSSGRIVISIPLVDS